MRNPEYVLKALNEHGQSSDYKFERLYRILFNEEMFYAAYQNIYAKPGNMTPGTDGKTIDQMNIPRIRRIIESLKDESYQPNPARRVYIPKKNGKQRPLGIPSFEDKLVQEVLRMILEAIYEPTFENTSHGFRPSRSPHTALIAIQKTFTGAKWFVEGDIKGFFDNIDHEILISILGKRIHDGRFLRLIRKFLKAGYVEDWQFNNTYSGTPQGGIISPILANIYLDVFDKYITEYAENFNKGKGRRPSKEYARLSRAAIKLRDNINQCDDKEKRKQLIAKYKEAVSARQSISSGDPMDTSYRRLQYIRYADDFLIGVIGTKAECVKIKEDITEFMSEKLHLEMSQEKTLITHAQTPAKFLSFEIFVRKSKATKRDVNNNPVVGFNGKVVLNLPMELVRAKLESYKAIRYKSRNGATVWFPKCRGKLMKRPVHEIVALYNAEIRGFYNYYSIANNVSFATAKFGYIMEYSMYSTIAAKLNSSTSKVIDRYKVGNDIIVPYKDSKGKERHTIFYNGGFKRKDMSPYANVDLLPHVITVPQPTLIERLKDGICELCGQKGELTMHHVRKLSLLKGENEWERLMLKRHRKTLAVCSSCMQNILAKSN